MKLQPILVTKDDLAKNVARQILQQIKSVRDSVVKIRSEGVPARLATEERTLPDGRVIPASAGVPAIPASAIDAALGAENCAVLDEIKNLID
jgi:hypothetical protein